MKTRAQELMEAAQGGSITSVVAKVKAGIEADLERQARHVPGGPSFSEWDLSEMAKPQAWSHQVAVALREALEADGWTITKEHPKDSNSRGGTYWKLRA